MGDSRIVYGLALGKQGNWYSLWQNRTHGVLAQASTAPDVTNGCLFYTVNSAATTIKDFKLSVAGSPDTGGNIAPLFEGKVIKVFFTDSLTTVSGSRIYLAGTNNTFQVNSWLGLVYHNSAWYETERSQPRGVNEAKKTISVGGTNMAVTLDKNINLYVLTGTNAETIVTGLSGGYIGQRITLINGSGGCLVFLSTDGGSIQMVGTNMAAISVNSENGLHAVNGVCISDAKWAFDSNRQPAKV